MNNDGKIEIRGLFIEVGKEYISSIGCDKH